MPKSERLIVPVLVKSETTAFPRIWSGAVQTLRFIGRQLTSILWSVGESGVCRRSLQDHRVVERGIEQNLIAFCFQSCVNVGVVFRRLAMFLFSVKRREFR
jgi:hypothetical protein